MSDGYVNIHEHNLLSGLMTHKSVWEAYNQIGITEHCFEERKWQRLFGEFARHVSDNGYEKAQQTILTGKPAVNKLAIDALYGEADMYQKILDEFGFQFVKQQFNEWRQKGINRTLDEILGGLRSSVYNGGSIDGYFEQLRRVSKPDRPDDIMDAEQMAEAVRNQPSVKIYPVGQAEIDEIARVESSFLIVIAGESSSGKTVLANQLTVEQLERGYGVMYFSLETDQKRLTRRFLRHIEYRFHMDRDQALERYASYGKSLKVSKLIDDIADIEDVIRGQHKSMDHLKYVVVDYLQEVDCSTTNVETEMTRIVSKKLHKLAQELDLIVVLLCQLNKENLPGTKDRKRFAPTMQSLRGHGSIGNAADVILINWFTRPRIKGEKMLPIACEVVKNKEASTGHVPLILNGPALTFEKYDDDPRQFGDDDEDPSYGDGPVMRMR